MKMMGKMLAFFLIVTTISLIGFAIVIMDSMDTKADIARVQAEEIPRFTMVAQIMENSLRQVVNIRGYAISRDPQQIENFKKLQETNRKLEEDLLKIARTEEGRKLIGDLINKQSVYSETVNREVVPAVLAGDPAVLAAAVQKAGAYSDQALAIGTDLKDRYYGAANTALAGAVASADNTINMAIIAAVVSLILSIVVAVFCSVGLSSKIRMLSVLAQKVADGDLTDSYKGSIPKDEIGDLSAALNLMVKNLKHMVITIGSQSQTLAASSEELTASADQSANAAQQVAGSVTEVADATVKQLESVKNTNNIVENMVAELEEVSANVSLVADKALETANMATTGGKSADKAISQMGEVEKTVSQSAAVVKHLGERSKEIGQIIDTITGIAGQTNLLALNAAIEAARAGEQGRGFAVVAEEVRKLAEQSQEASKKIATLIGEIQIETERAVNAMENGTKEVKIGAEVVNETGVSFQEIIALVNQVSDQVKSIAGVIHKVAQGSEQIVSSVQYISELSTAASSEVQTVSAATEEQSASMQEIAASSQNLSRLAQDMQLTVERFRI